jgi:hypothetical protein
LASSVFYDHARRKWGYQYKRETVVSWETEDAAFKAYVGQLVKEPKYQQLFHGKTWADIKRMVG